MKQKIISYLSLNRLIPALLMLSIISVGIMPAAAAQAEPLPKAEKIFDRYVEATGGMQAYDNIRNRVSKSTIEIVGAGIKLAVKAYQVKPNKSYTVIESTATGKIEAGTDGNVVWEVSVMSGPQVWEGKKRTGMLHLSIFDKEVYWRKTYKKVECVAVENVDEKPCYKVIAAPHEANPETLFFDKKSNLLLKVAMTVENPMGQIPAEAYLSDYKKVDGILIPHKNKILVMGMERIIILESIEHNVDMPKDRFDLPAEIKTLLEKKKEEKEKKKVPVQ